MSIVGWFIVSGSIRPEKNNSVERTHIDGIGRHKVLAYINPQENIEEFYSCFDGGLEQLDGYTVYFEKNEEMQSYISTVHKERKRTRNDDMVIRKYRQLLKENNYEPKARKQLSFTYALSMILVIFVLVLGVGRLQAEDEPTQAETTTENTANYVEEYVDVNATVPQIEDETLNIDFVEGNVTTEAQTDETEPVTTETESGSDITDESVQEETTTETSAEATTAEPARKTYTIQQGDTLYSILTKEYGNLDKLQELLDVNGITDGGDSIQVGDELILP
jgi:LysM repeat protein